MNATCEQLRDALDAGADCRFALVDALLEDGKDKLAESLRLLDGKEPRRGWTLFGWRWYWYCPIGVKNRTSDLPAWAWVHLPEGIGKNQWYLPSSEQWFAKFLTRDACFIALDKAVAKSLKPIFAQVNQQ